MAVNWDNLFTQYSNWQAPDYTKQNQRQPMQDRFSTFAEPEYNYEPSRRYSEYLGSEPQRDKYKPGFFGNILNSLSAGMEAYNTGSLGRASQLFNYLNDQPYERARSDWETRGNKIKADVDLENNRYRNAVQAVDRAAQRANQERNTQTAETNARTSMERLDLERQRLQGNEWDLVDGPEGTQIRVNKRTQETQPTNLPNSKLTPEQQIRQFEQREQGLDRRHVTPSGSARLGAATSRANVQDTIGARTVESERDRAFRASENDKDREVSRWRHTTPSASISQPKEKVATPTNTRTPVGLVENGYPEFNTSDLIRLDGNGITVQTNPDKVHEVLKRLSGGDLKKYQELEARFEEFKLRAQSLGGR